VAVFITDKGGLKSDSASHDEDIAVAHILAEAPNIRKLPCGDLTTRFMPALGSRLRRTPGSSPSFAAAAGFWSAAAMV